MRQREGDEHAREGSALPYQPHHRGLVCREDNQHRTKEFSAAHKYCLLATPSTKGDNNLPISKNLQMHHFHDIYLIARICCKMYHTK